MNEFITVMAWLTLQVTLVGGVCWSIAILLRGRFPQLASSILSGACVSVLVLTIVACLPLGQSWTAKSWLLALSKPSLEPTSAQRDLATTSPQQFPVKTAEPKLSEASVDNSRLRWSGRPSVTGWLGLQLTTIDRKIQRIAEYGSNSARNPYIYVLIAFMAVTFSAFCMLSFLHVNRMIAGSQELVDKNVPRLVEELTGSLGLKRIPRILESDQILVGATAGWRRPVILLSSSYQTWTGPQLHAVVAHELAHVARQDYLWAMLGSLCRMFLWFNPIVHLLLQRLRFEQELAADQIAASTMNANAYGRALAQLSLACQLPKRTHSPMLAANHVCILRRISMLKQGRLKACRRVKWCCTALTLVIAAAALPLTGLRAQQQDELQAPASNSNRSPEVQAEIARFAAVQAKYPPFVASGTMVYRQAKMNHVEKIGLANHWFASLMQVIGMGDTLPSDCILHGQAGIKLQWEDMQKEKGRLQLPASIDYAENTKAGQLSRLVAEPVFSPYALSEQTQNVAGRTAQAFVYRHSDTTTPRVWVIDDQQGYHRATSLDELSEQLQARAIPSIPPALQSDFESAAAAVVFDNCSELRKRYDEYVEGATSSIAAPPAIAVLNLLKDLQSLGVFLQSETGKLNIKLVFSEVENASVAIAAIQPLAMQAIAALEATDPEEASVNADQAEAQNQLFAGLFREIEFQQTGNAVTVSLPGDFYAHAALHEFSRPDTPVPGWSSFPYGEQEEVTTGELVVEEASVGAVPAWASQTVNAAAFRGQRIRLACEIKCSEGFEDLAGFASWANDQADQPVAFASTSVDTSSDLLKVLVHSSSRERRDFATEDEARSNWKAVSLELDIPQDASNIVVAVYCKAPSMHVRRMKFEKVGAASASVRTTAPALLRAFNIPGRTVHSSPTNLGFEPVLDGQVATSKVASQADAVAR